MKTKTIITLAIAAGLLVFIFMFARSCGLTNEYKRMRSEYNEYKLIVEADHKLMSIRVDELTQEIGHMDETIVKLRAEAKVKDEKIRVTQAELAELQAAEPSQPELESQPLVISLRKQVNKLTEMFSLAQETIADKDRIIFELGVPELVGMVNGKKIFKYPVGSVTWALNEQSKAWKNNYNGELNLRLSCENLLTMRDHRGIIFKVFGLRIDLVKDVLVPGGLFTFGYLLGGSGR